MMNSFGDNSINLSSNECKAESSESETRQISNSVFTDDDFKIPVNRFVEDLDLLEKNSNVKSDDNCDASLARMSLFRQFDPLVDNKYEMNDQLISKTLNLSLNECNSNIMSETNDNITMISANESTTLMNFNSPLIVTNNNNKTNSVQKNSYNNESFILNDNNSCDQMSNDFKTKELLFQEKLLEKDRKIFNLEEKLTVFSGNCEKYEQLLNLLHNFNQEVVEMASELVENLVEEKNDLIERCNQMTAEKGQALDDVNSVEKSFYEVHNRYDKVRTALEESKAREMQFNEQYLDLVDKLNEKEQMYELLKAKAEEKIENANSYIESARRECESELIAVKAQLKRSEMKINGLQAQLDQKSIENNELTKMVDELIANVEK